MERSELTHGSEAWKVNRNKPGTVNSSSAGSHVGINEDDTTFRHIKDPLLRSQSQVRANFEFLKDASKNMFEGNWYTRRGTFYEPVAIKVFEKARDLVVKPSSSWQSKEYPWLFATPDGLIWKDDLSNLEGVLEVKNPNSKLHKKIPAQYMCQMQLQMHCTGTKECWFVSNCLKLDKARIWLISFSQEYFDWLLPQLQYLHEEALKGTAADNLDMSKFDFKPPFVQFSLMHEIKSVQDLVGSIEEFPEPCPYQYTGRKRKTSPKEEEKVEVIEEEEKVEVIEE